MENYKKDYRKYLKTQKLKEAKRRMNEEQKYIRMQCAFNDLNKKPLKRKMEIIMKNLNF